MSAQNRQGSFLVYRFEDLPPKGRFLFFMEDFCKKSKTRPGIGQSLQMVGLKTGRSANCVRRGCMVQCVYPVGVCLLHTIGILRYKKEENNIRSDSRCGSVETCRNACMVLLCAVRECTRHLGAFRVSKYGKFNPEERQEDLPPQRR